MAPFALTIVVFEGGLAIWVNSVVTRPSPSQAGYILSTTSSPVTGACESESNEVLSIKLTSGSVIVAVPPIREAVATRYSRHGTQATPRVWRRRLSSNCVEVNSTRPSFGRTSSKDDVCKYETPERQTVTTFGC